MNEWLVWSAEHGAWWAPNERGYTKDISAAGRYSSKRAAQIVANAFPGHEAAIPLACLQWPA